MIEVRQTAVFAKWFEHFGMTELVIVSPSAFGASKWAILVMPKPVGGAVNELRIDYEPGYRVYFTKRERLVVILLCGGDKSSQGRDIKMAQELAAQLE